MPGNLTAPRSSHGATLTIRKNKKKQKLFYWNIWTCKPRLKVRHFYIKESIIYLDQTLGTFRLERSFSGFIKFKCLDWQAFRHISNFEKILSDKKCSRKISRHTNNRAGSRKIWDGRRGMFLTWISKPIEWRIGDFKMPRQRRQRERQKGTRLNRKTTTLHVHHTFLYISLPSQHDYDVKMPSFTFYGGPKQATAKFSFSFWNWIWFLGNRLKKGSLAFGKVNELE